MLAAGQIMTKNVITVRMETPITDAARLLVEKKISGLPVVDDARKLRGIISEKDLLRILMDANPKKCVSDYMTKKVVSFQETDSMGDICEFLGKHNIRRIPIVDQNGRLVGIVSRRDIIAEILKLPRLLTRHHT